MSGYNKIIAQFSKIGYSQSSNFKQSEIKRALDEICLKNANIRNFNGDVANELWDEVQKNNDGTVQLKDYVNIIVKAQQILQQHIKICEQQLKGNVDQGRRQELEEGIAQYDEDLKVLTLPFQLPAPAQSKYVQSKANFQSSRLSGNKSHMSPDGSVFSGRASAIFADVPSQRENSISLKITFIITFVLFMVEILMMFNKHHFLNLLAYLSVFAILGLGYFDKYYMKFVLILLAISIVFDLFWLFLESNYYWSPAQINQHSTIQTTFLRFTFIFVALLMAAKVLLILMLFRYRNNQDGTRKSVSFFGNQFHVDGRVKQNNMISKLLSGKGRLSNDQE